MNSNPQNPFAGDGAMPSTHGVNSDAEATLRLMARLPAPEGLEDRVRRALETAPRHGSLLAWPAAIGTGGGWMRAAAAAAIAFVVAGGGWGVYSRVQQERPTKTIAMPVHVGGSGSFSSAGAMRMPQTLNGPVLTHPVKDHGAPGKTPHKNAARAGHAPKTAAKPATAPTE